MVVMMFTNRQNMRAFISFTLPWYNFSFFLSQNLSPTFTSAYNLQVPQNHALIRRIKREKNIKYIEEKVVKKKTSACLSRRFCVFFYCLPCGSFSSNTYTHTHVQHSLSLLLSKSCAFGSANSQRFTRPKGTHFQKLKFIVIECISMKNWR